MAKFLAVASDRISGNTVEFSSNIRGEIGAKCVLYRGSESELEFHATALIDSIELRPEYGGQDLHLGILSSHTSLVRPLNIIDISGSLEKITHFLDPWFHFRRIIVTLSELDFFTIVDGQIDFPRSIFRKLFHSLPLRVQTDFVRRQSTLGIENARSITEYNEIALKLLEYLNYNVKVKLQLLRLLADSYPPFSGEIPPLSVLHFGSDTQKEEEELGTFHIGEDILALSNSRSIDRLFQNEGALLHECFTVLSDNPESTRQWHDPIFFETSTTRRQS